MCEAPLQMLRCSFEKLACLPTAPCLSIPTCNVRTLQPRVAARGEEAAEKGILACTTDQQQHHRACAAGCWWCGGAGRDGRLARLQPDQAAPDRAGQLARHVLQANLGRAQRAVAVPPHTGALGDQHPACVPPAAAARRPAQALCAAGPKRSRIVRPGQLLSGCTPADASMDELLLPPPATRQHRRHCRPLPLLTGPTGISRTG
jgi:hypothetical protein